jgi:hypothetical protein
MKYHIWWVVAGAVALCALSMPHTVKVVPVFAANTVVTKQKVLASEEIAYTIPLLKRICSCESAYGSPNNEPRQFDSNGHLIVGQTTPGDWGQCQINSKVWLPTADKLGYDIRTASGNYKMAVYIYDTYGTQPWNASRGCWQES